jgi:hypothetical protein
LARALEAEEREGPAPRLFLWSPPFGGRANLAGGARLPRVPLLLPPPGAVAVEPPEPALPLPFGTFVAVDAAAAALAAASLRSAMAFLLREGRGLRFDGLAGLPPPPPPVLPPLLLLLLLLLPPPPPPLWAGGLPTEKPPVTAGGGTQRVVGAGILLSLLPRMFFCAELLLLLLRLSMLLPSVGGCGSTSISSQSRATVLIDAP